MACLWPPVTFELIINLKSAKALRSHDLRRVVPDVRRQGDRNATVTVAVEMIKSLLGGNSRLYEIQK
jgi:hypothetical protein